MPYNPTKRKPVDQLTPFEVLVFELRASGMSERDMYLGLRKVMSRKPPSYKEIREALDASGADPHSAGRGGVRRSHLLYTLEAPEGSTEPHAYFKPARRVGTSARYPDFVDDRKRESRSQRLGKVPSDTVQRLIENQIVGHLVRVSFTMKQGQLFETRAAEEYVDRLESGGFTGEGSG